MVEDDTALAMGTTYALESEGMQVIHTTDCAQTRKVCGTDQKIDLVLLDVMLPDGDGFSLCEWLKGEQPDIPVIFLTALEDEGNVVHGLQYALLDLNQKNPYNNFMTKCSQNAFATK